MRVLGIDPGYARCGYAVLNYRGNSIEWLDSGVIETQASDDLSTRMAWVFRSIELIITQHQPDLIAMEQLYFARNVTTGLKVAMVRGIIATMAGLHQINLTEPTPKEVKVAVTGNGAAEKFQIQFMLQRLLKVNHPVKYDDEWDAMAVAYCGCINQRPLSD